MPNLQTIDILEIGHKCFNSLQNLIFREYGFADMQEVVFPPVISFTSKKAVFSAKRGEKSGKYFLKEKPEYAKNELGLNLSFAMQKYLSLHNQSVPPILKTLSGNDYLLIGDRIFFITPYIEGKYYSGKKEEAFQAGVKLGQLHKLSMSIGKKLGFDIRKNTPSDLGIYFLDLAVVFANKNRCLFQTEAICEIRRYLNEAVKIFNSVPPARFILSHGDYSPFNLVFESKNCKVIAVNDFDNVALLLRVHDLAEAILTFSYISYRGCSSNFANVLPEKINFQMASAVLKGYTSVIKLENDEKRFLDKAAMSIWIELISLGIIREDFGFTRLFDFNNIRKQVESFFKKL